MSFVRLAAQLVLGFAALLVSLPATAATYLITYTGKMATGLDETGVFFAPNTSLIGKAFTLQYTLTYPGVGIVDINTPQQLALSGGNTVGNGLALSPLVGVLTINGISESFGGVREARFERANTSNFEGFNEYLSDFSTSGNFSNYKEIQTTFYGNSSNFLSSVDPAAGGLNFSLIGYRGTVIAGFGINDREQIGSNLGVPVTRLVRGAGGTFFLESFSQQAIINNNAVPEPATWMMMLAGFGMAGAMIRRNRLVSAAA